MKINTFLSLFALPVLAGCVIYSGLSGVVTFHQANNYDQLTSVNEYRLIFGVLAFFFGFLPCLLYGVAVRAMGAPAAASAPVVEAAPVLFVGMVISAPAYNCAFRIKALNVPALLEYANPDYLDYL